MSNNTLTVAFELETLQKVENPAAVFEDARTWSSYVGVISDQMAYQVVNYLRDNGIYNEDFFSRADKKQSLQHIQRQTDTDRYVFIGLSPEHEWLADETGWEYLTIGTAAEKADWNLAVSEIHH